MQKFEQQSEAEWQKPAPMALQVQTPFRQLLLEHCRRVVHASPTALRTHTPLLQRCEQHSSFASQVRPRPMQ